MSRIFRQRLGAEADGFVKSGSGSSVGSQSEQGEMSGGMVDQAIQKLLAYAVPPKLVENVDVTHPPDIRPLKIRVLMHAADADHPFSHISTEQSSAGGIEAVDAGCVFVEQRLDEAIAFAQTFGKQRLKRGSIQRVNRRDYGVHVKSRSSG